MTAEYAGKITAIFVANKAGYFSRGVGPPPAALMATKTSIFRLTRHVFLTQTKFSFNFW